MGQDEWAHWPLAAREFLLPLRSSQVWPPAVAEGSHPPQTSQRDLQRGLHPRHCTMTTGTVDRSVHCLQRPGPCDALQGPHALLAIVQHHIRELNHACKPATILMCLTQPASAQRPPNTPGSRHHARAAAPLCWWREQGTFEGRWSKACPGPAGRGCLGGCCLGARSPAQHSAASAGQSPHCLPAGGLGPQCHNAGPGCQGGLPTRPW